MWKADDDQLHAHQQQRSAERPTSTRTQLENGLQQLVGVIYAWQCLNDDANTKFIILAVERVLVCNVRRPNHTHTHKNTRETNMFSTITRRWLDNIADLMRKNSVMIAYCEKRVTEWSLCANIIVTVGYKECGQPAPPSVNVRLFCLAAVSHTRAHPLNSN